MRTVSLLNYTRCSIFDIKSKPYPHCLKYIDQTNCSDIELVGGIVICIVTMVTPPLLVTMVTPLLLVTMVTPLLIVTMVTPLPLVTMVTPLLIVL